MSASVHSPHDLNWLLTNFVERVAHVIHAVVVSAEGLALAFNSKFPKDQADQLAAATAGLVSLTAGAARAFEGGRVVQTAVAMEAGVLTVMTIGNGASLTVLASSKCDLGLVSYEMALLADRTGQLLTPAIREVNHVAVLESQA